MKINTFEESLVWQKSQDLATDLREIILTHKDYSFKDQIMRAVTSISNNIGEGFERRTNNELKYFLYVSKGSCGEVRSMVHLAYRWKYLSEAQYALLYNYCLEISKMLSGRIKTL